MGSVRVRTCTCTRVPRRTSARECPPDHRSAPARVCVRVRMSMIADEREGASVCVCLEREREGGCARSVPRPTLGPRELKGWALGARLGSRRDPAAGCPGPLPWGAVKGPSDTDSRGDPSVSVTSTPATGCRRRARSRPRPWSLAVTVDRHACRGRRRRARGLRSA